MNTGKITMILAIIILCNPIIFGQNIQLTTGKKSKSIKADTYVKVSIPVPGREPCDVCPVNEFTGRTISYQQGLLKLEVHQSYEVLLKDEMAFGTAYKVYDLKKDSFPVMDIPKDQILSITKKGKNKVREYPAGDIVAMTLAVLVVGQISALPFADEDKDAVLALVGTEIVVAAVLGSVSKQKTFVTNEHCPSAQSGNKKENLDIGVIPDLCPPTLRFRTFLSISHL